MVSHTCILSEEQLQCSICQHMLTNPVCIPCGHTFCLSCISDYWDGRQQEQCPNCEEVFPSRPRLSVNVFLSKLIHRLRRSGLDNVVQICEQPVSEPHSTTTGLIAGRTLLLLCILAVTVGYAAYMFQDTAPFKLAEPSDQRTVIQKQEVENSQKLRESLEGNMQMVVRLMQTMQTNLDRKLDNLSKKVSVLQKNMLEINTTKLGRVFEKETAPEKKMRNFRQYAVDVTLDPDTAHPSLLISSDGKQLRHGHIHSQQNLSNHPKRFDYCISVLGKEGFTSGRFYYEVQVKGKTNWDLGVVRGSINRKGKIVLGPTNGYWTIWLRNEDSYAALDITTVPISLKNRPETVGVFVDYEEGLVSFYDGDSGGLIYSFTGVSFTDETLYPYFSPGLSSGGKNAAPMIISRHGISSESSEGPISPIRSKLENEL
ncbi:nuclear factor 7, brain-like [Sardina pilchardus]|uniref:nuclear factor 7, brain-like n=1 Tax=Sardina pilchardus TaxID=27697 RepID=UPI002E1393B7